MRLTTPVVATATTAAVVIDAKSSSSPFLAICLLILDLTVVSGMIMLSLSLINNL